VHEFTLGTLSGLKLCLEMHVHASVYLPGPSSHSTLQHSQQQAHALGTHYVHFIYIDFLRSFYFTKYKILTAVCQVSDSATKLWESPFWDQGQHDTKDVIGHFNSATEVDPFLQKMSHPKRGYSP
jgi:hypothetical protein